MIRPLVDLPYLVIGTLLLLGFVVVGLVTARRDHRGSWWRRGLMVLLLAAIALRPAIGMQPTPSRVAPLEVLVVIDRTTSMSARDWNGSHPRLDGVRRDVADLLAALPSGRFTVVTFGRDVRVELPSTQDETLIAETLSMIRREQVYAGSGSRIDRPLETIRRLLKRMEQRQPDRPRLVVLMADGENTDPAPQRSFRSVAPLVDSGVVLAYGTHTGGPMPLDEDAPEQGWVQDPDTGAPARSILDEANLQRVASQLGLNYLHRQTPAGLDAVVSKWETAFREEVSEEGSDVPARHELTWLLALLLLVVALPDLRGNWRRFLQARRELA